jgi:hypothetical protein
VRATHAVKRLISVRSAIATQGRRALAMHARHRILWCPALVTRAKLENRGNFHGYS